MGRLMHPTGHSFFKLDTTLDPMSVCTAVNPPLFSNDEKKPTIHSRWAFVIKGSFVLNLYAGSPAKILSMLKPGGLLLYTNPLSSQPNLS